jgi:hypothetical protein
VKYIPLKKATLYGHYKKLFAQPESVGYYGSPIFQSANFAD